MEIAGIYVALIAVAALCGWGARAAWMKGWRGAVLAALVLVLLAAALFWYLASIATGSYLAGLGEALIAIALLAGPGAGICLGILAARSLRPGLLAGFAYATGLALLLSSL